jgi:UDP-2,3-diacylglucosamine hydrolase
LEKTTTIKLLKEGILYFASDFHLGVPSYEKSLEREKKIIVWLDSIKKDAAAIFLMGDVFDFWFEYKTVVPKGYTRLLGKLAELTDSGIPIHLFRGNHDIWAFDYLNKEVGIQLHRTAIICEFQGKTFHLVHGDGLGPGDLFYKFLKHMFEFRLNQWLFNWLHPNVGTKLGLYLSKKSRISKIATEKKSKNIIPLHDEMLYKYSVDVLKNNPEINYFIYGHRHLPIQKNLNNKSQLIILGDWISHYSYAVFDGKELKLENFLSK